MSRSVASASQQWLLTVARMQPARCRWPCLRRFRAESGERGTELACGVAIPDSARPRPRQFSRRRAGCIRATYFLRLDQEYQELKARVERQGRRK